MGKVKMHFDYFTPSLVRQLIQRDIRPEVDNRQNRTIPIIWQQDAKNKNARGYIKTICG